MAIVWTPQAINSLHDIFQFYSNQAGRSKALEIIADIRKHTLYLHVFPLMGAHEGNTPYHYLVKRGCKIFYDIMEDDNIAIILVWDTRRDPHQLAQLLQKS